MHRFCIFTTERRVVSSALGAVFWWDRPLFLLLLCRAQILEMSSDRQQKHNRDERKNRDDQAGQVLAAAPG